MSEETKTENVSDDYLKTFGKGQKAIPAIRGSQRAI